MKETIKKTIPVFAAVAAFCAFVPQAEAAYKKTKLLWKSDFTQRRLRAENLEFTYGGQLAFRDGTTMYVAPAKAQGAAFSKYSQVKGTLPDAGTMTSQIEIPGVTKGAAVVSRCDGGLRYSAELRCISEKGAGTEGCAIVVSLPMNTWEGSIWRFDAGVPGAREGVLGSNRVSAARMKSFSLECKDGRRIELTFDRPVKARAWTRKVFFRPNLDIKFSAADFEPFAKGGESKLSCVLKTDGTLEAKAAPYCEVAGGDEWIPFEYKKDIVEGSALDFSGMGIVDAPAGKYGRVIVSGGHFAFEKRPGARQRFYGVNMGWRTIHPPKEVTDALVPRLVRLGYNSIRIHHHDLWLMKGDDGLKPVGWAADAFDYLVSKAVEGGLYLTTDLYVARRVTWRSLGVDKDGKVSPAEFKRLVLMGHPQAVENLKSFTRWFLTHKNKYTGRTLADEPALMSISLLNEAHLTKSWRAIESIPYVKDTWGEWVAANGDSDNSKHRFAVTREMLTERDLKAFVRELGYKGLITGDNNPPYFVAGRAKLGEIYDYVDRHTYIDHPFFPGEKWRLPRQYENGNALVYPGGYMSAVGCARHYGMPFTVTEWNYSGSSPYRSMSGLMTGALACVQDWDAMWRFVYATQIDELSDGSGRSQMFDLAGDALLQATDRTATALFLLGDLPPAKTGAALELPARHKILLGDPMLLDSEWAKSRMWKSRIGTAFPGKAPRGVKMVPPAEWTAPCKSADYGVDGGPVRIDSKGRFSTVTTKRVCGGFAEEGVACRAGPFAFTAKGHRATVSAVSLDGKPLEKSGRVLVTYLTDVADEGAAYLGELRNFVMKQVSPDVARPMVHAGVADIAFEHENSAEFTAWALDTSGRRVRKVPTRVVSGRLRFAAEISRGKPEMYYELVKTGD